MDGTPNQIFTGPAQTGQMDPRYRNVQNLPGSLSYTTVWGYLTHLAGTKEQEAFSSQETLSPNTQNTLYSTELSKNRFNYKLLLKYVADLRYFSLLPDGIPLFDKKNTEFP